MVASLERLIIEMRRIFPCDSSLEAYKELSQLIGKGYAVKTEKNGTRAIISGLHEPSDFKREFTHQVNGLIVDFTTGRILALPVKRYNHKPTREFFNYSDEKMKKYRIEKVQDGTVITLYYHNDSWQISSSGGYAMNNMTWIGKMTYEQLLLDIDPDIFSKLEKNKSYTFGIHHPEIHPLPRDPKRIWMYCTCDIDAINEESPRVIIDQPDIGYEYPPVVQFTSLRDMIDKNKKALSEYTTGGDIHYGYILRGSFDEFGEHANVLLESSLMQKIKKNFYNATKKYKNVQITPDTREKIICIISYFSSLPREFVTLFPQYEVHHRNIAQIVNTITNEVYLASTNKNSRVALHRIKHSQNDKLPIVCKSIAKIILDQLEKNGTFNGHTADARDIINDYVNNTSMVEYYCEKLVKFI